MFQNALGDAAFQLTEAQYNTLIDNFDGEEPNDDVKEVLKEIFGMTEFDPTLAQHYLEEVGRQLEAWYWENVDLDAIEMPPMYEEVAGYFSETWNIVLAEEDFRWFMDYVYTMKEDYEEGEEMEHDSDDESHEEHEPMITDEERERLFKIFQV
jgi:hypothetical protein